MLLGVAVSGDIDDARRAQAAALLERAATRCTFLVLRTGWEGIPAYVESCEVPNEWNRERCALKQLRVVPLAGRALDALEDLDCSSPSSCFKGYDIP